MCSGRRTARSRSLGTLEKSLARQWHPTKNGTLTPFDVTPHSGRRVWWQCGVDPAHEWQSKIGERSRAALCPFCTHRKIVPRGPETLAKAEPDLARQWHATKNGKLTPLTVYARSTRKVWWQCRVAPDHVWNAAPSVRIALHTGCPACAGLKVSVTNSLASRAPAIAAEWHPTANGPLRPRDVTAGSTRVVVWRCKTDRRHEWSSSVSARVTAKGCPVCAGKRVSANTSLKATFPRIAAQWHPTRNGALRATDVVPGASKRVWWKCAKGPDHEWQSSVQNRTKRNSPCEFCNGRRASRTNSVAALHPTLARQWHPTRNGALRPADIVPGSNRNVWWKCPKGADHEWRVSVQNRTKTSSRCPFCIGRRLSLTNSLAALYPRIARQWHPTRNGARLPAETLPSSASHIWWRCEVGHQWCVSPKVRVYAATGCPACYALRARRRRPSTKRHTRETVRMPSRR